MSGWDTTPLDDLYTRFEVRDKLSLLVMVAQLGDNCIVIPRHYDSACYCGRTVLHEGHPGDFSMSATDFWTVFPSYEHFFNVVGSSHHVCVGCGRLIKDHK